MTSLQKTDKFLVFPATKYYQILGIDSQQMRAYNRMVSFI